jgi:ADP-L-glycero-D-manno-heptose 6-epimerase
MIILTGSEGFIGKNFIKAFTGQQIIKIDKHNFHMFVDEFHSWDKVDLIIHQGAISSTTEKDVRALYEWNIKASLDLFDIAIRHKIPVKYASSASVYGNLQGEFNPINHYAMSKLQVDYWVKDHIDDFSLIQGFRYFNVYGDHEDHKGDQASPVSKFTKQIEETGILRLFEGSDEFKRDFICVNDIVDIVLNNNKPSGVYDLGTSNPISFQDVAESVAARYNGRIETISFPDNLVGKYQKYTCAKQEWGDYEFTTIEEYLDGK